MNTKPKAKKFRVRKSGSLTEGLASAAPARPDGGLPDGKNPASPKRPQSAPKPAAKPSVDQPTMRQMRMARRLAERKGLKIDNDEDAIKALKARGIDPFVRNGLQVVPPTPPAERVAAAAAQAKTEVTVAKSTVPAPARPQPPAQEDAEKRRAAEIIQMQRDIAKRRQRKLIGLGVRLGLFVAAPTIAAMVYFTSIATPMFATHSEFIIQQADAPSQSPAGGLLAGTGLANSQDSIEVQSFLQSREAMLRLDADHGFRAHYSDPEIDALQRLKPDATYEAAYRKYQRNVRISYDPTHGIIRMEVVAADPQVSTQFSTALIAYAEEQVDQSTQRVRQDQMAGATESYDDAELKMLEAQRRVLDLQEARGVLSAEAEVSSLMNQISTFEVELKQERLALQSLMDNARPNKTKVGVAERNISRLEAMIAEMRAEMTQGSSGGASLARVTGELVVAEAELETRQMMVAAALQQLEVARIEANRQVRYLLQVVRPTPTDEAIYPRAFENTLLAFLIFAGLYLMISLTASILREQVSA
jgi:capsular polysaccharide transport system permease protein